MKRAWSWLLKSWCWPIDAPTTPKNRNTLTPESYFAPLEKMLESHADSQRAAGARAYMRNIADYYGIAAPIRQQIVSGFIAKHGLPELAMLDDCIRYSWEQPQREWQYCAMEICQRVVRKSEVPFISMAEWMIKNKSWWDTVDYIAPNIVGGLFKRNTELRDETIAIWRHSGHLWLMRSCLIFQLKYGKGTDAGLLFGLCAEMAGHKDFFIRKGIGWSLRQYSKYNPVAVRSFVEGHALSGLSTREALKWMERHKLPE